MSLINKYLQACKNINSLEELSIATFDFLKKTFPEIRICLLRHQPKPDALEIVKTNYEKPDEYWFNLLKESYVLNNDKVLFESVDHLFCLSSIEFLSEKICVFILKRKSIKAVEDLLDVWCSLTKLLIATNQSTEKTTINEQGNLISQLLHDVQSLMEVKSQNNLTNELKSKLEYQKKLNKSLLFYIREFDLFKSEIEISKFIYDSLAEIDISKDQFLIDLPNPDLEISIDVELFSEAFNQIILNALDAVDKDFSRLKIRISTCSSNSPFIENNWVVIEINDAGKGISDDFIPYVLKPFFTTQKYKNHSGFGLSNAKKIVDGHNGFLEINSNNGTQVKIIIPQN